MAQHWHWLRCLPCSGEFKSLRDRKLPVGRIVETHCPHCKRICSAVTLAEADAPRPDEPKAAPAAAAPFDPTDISWMERAWLAPSYSGPRHRRKVNGYRI